MPTQRAPRVAYMTSKKWGVKLPLSESIKDAYYVVPTGISLNADGLPSGIFLGLTSRNSNCGTISSTGRGTENTLGEIVRSLPTDHDPVSGKLYTQLNPDGVTINAYYYGYTSSSKNNTCAPATTLQSINSDFVTATKSTVKAASN